MIMRSDCHEENEVYGGSDRFCVEAGGDGGEGGRSVPEDGDQRSHFLQLDGVGAGSCSAESKPAPRGAIRAEKLLRFELSGG